MKYKIKHEKGNLVFMTSVIIMCLITCGLWLMLKEYTYFSIYLIITLLIAIFYYFTYYYLKDNYLIIKVGFINVKIKYKKIKKIDNLQNSIRLTYGKISMNIYPNNKDIFFAELSSKVKGK